MILYRLLAIIFSVICFSFAAHAQTATLLADSVVVNGNSTIEAKGNVEVLYLDTRLKAARIIYNQDDGTLQIDGPITLIQGKKTYILADSAELSADLQNGIMRGATLVLDQQLQLAATEIARVEGRYTQLYQTVASSCQVCANSPVPLWQIRAQKIIHDQQEQQIYFENATFMLANVPIFYLPRLRMPDPALKRATGVLTPQYRGSSLLGQGIKLPYFIAVGDSSDITLTPYLAEKTTTLEARYRQVFRKGSIQFNGALSFDELKSSPRAYLFGSGKFSIPRNFDLSFGLQLTTDESYLRDYDYSDQDRLKNNITLERIQNDAIFRAELLGFQPVFGPELTVKNQLPNFQGEIYYQKRFFPDAIGGQGNVELSLQGYRRESEVDIIGRDRLRVSGRVGWDRNAMFGPGVLGRFGGTIGLDFYQISQDSNYPEIQTLISPGLEAELRWPLVKSNSRGVAMTLEPVIQLAWSDRFGGTVPNEDSTLVEFDQGNLFALSRFPGQDRYETGFRAATGVKWSRYDPNGWSMDVTLGRVFRSEENTEFSPASGLDGKNSNWLAATRFDLNDNLSIIARAQFDDELNATKAETRAMFDLENFSFASSYSWIIADPRENRPLRTQQLAFDGGFSLGRNWKGSLGVRYDFEANTPTRTKLRINYITECINIGLSLSRRFGSSTSVSTDTNFGFAVSLRGFGSNGRADRRTCSG